jgi:hypothetical protein
MGPCDTTGAVGYCVGAVPGIGNYATYQYGADAAAAAMPTCTQFGGTWCTP